MLPQAEKRIKRNSSKVNLLISLVFHGLIAVAVLYFAAREGLLGKAIKKIAVEMVKEKPPEKPKEPEKPKDELVKVETPKAAAKIEVPKEVVQAPPPGGNEAPPAAAPPAVDVASFNFEGGRAVETISDPVQLYKGLLEYAFRSRWDRPESDEDRAFVAEVEVSVDRSGKISNPVWKKNSGNSHWDATVRQAVALTPSISRPPPTNFPPRVTVRFDVAESEPVLQ